MQPILAMQPDGDGDHARRLIKQLSALLADADLDAGEFRLDLAAGPFRATVHVRMLAGMPAPGGRMLSEDEARVVAVFRRPDEWLVGKEIAARLGQSHNTKLRYLLMNMEGRAVLLHEDGKGYTLPATDAQED